MRKRANIIILTAVGMLALATAGWAWDVEYDASTGLLPTAASPAWETNSNNATVAISDGALCIGSGASDAWGTYALQTPPGGPNEPITLETRMCVTAPAGGAGANLFAVTSSAAVYVDIYPDYITTSDAQNQDIYFYGDFATYHTVRLAFDGISQADVWVDNQLAMSWVCGGYPFTSYVRCFGNLFGVSGTCSRNEQVPCRVGTAGKRG